MCEIITGSLLAALGGGGAATAVAGTAATLQTIGSIVAIGGSIYQGVSGMKNAKANAAAIEEQKRTEAKLNAVKDHRERMKFTSAIAQQSAEIAGRGVDLDSPTAIFLGQTAAQELAFNSQSIRSTGEARQSELSGAQENLLARGRQGLLRGGLSAAGAFLNKSPDQWQELLE